MAGKNYVNEAERQSSEASKLAKLMRVNFGPGLKMRVETLYREMQELSSDICNIEDPKDQESAGDIYHKMVSDGLYTFIKILANE